MLTVYIFYYCSIFFSFITRHCLLAIHVYKCFSIRINCGEFNIYEKYKTASFLVKSDKRFYFVFCIKCFSCNVSAINNGEKLYSMFDVNPFVCPSISTIAYCLPYVTRHARIQEVLPKGVQHLLFSVRGKRIQIQCSTKSRPSSARQRNAI